MSLQATAGLSGPRQRVAGVAVIALIASLLTVITNPAAAAPPPLYESAVLSDNPGAYWQFDGLPAVDLTTSVDTDTGAGVSAGAPSFTPTDTAYSFSGAFDSVVTTPYVAYDDYPLYYDTATTVELWLRTTSTALGTLVETKGYELTIDGGDLTFTVQSWVGGLPTVRTVSSATSVADGSWHHVVATYDQGDLSLFVDTNQSTNLCFCAPETIVNSDVGYASDPSLSIGAQLYGSQGFIGDIDEVAIYGTALTSTQIGSHFDAATDPTGYYAAEVPIVFGSSRPSSTTAGDPVETSSGNFTDTWVDLGFPGQVFAMDWSRTYNSLDAQPGVLGVGWSTLLDVTATVAGTDVDVTAPDGRVVTFADNGAGGWDRADEFYADLVVDGDGSIRVAFTDGTAWLFDTAGRLDGFESWDGQTVAITRDGTGVASTMASSTGHSLTFTYDPGSGLLTQVASSDGRTVAYSYDAGGHLVSVADPAGAATTFAVDGAGLLASITDPAGRPVITNTYDATGRVTAQTTPSGNIVTFAYDDVLGTTTVTDGASGDVTVYAHSPERRLISVTDAEGETVTRSYDGEGNLVAAVDRLASDIVQTFDGNGNLTSRTDREGNTTTFTYDTENRVTQITDPDAGVTA
ncbi:MAG: hypothetical protein GY701_21525, partial [Sulfitobacter sp.]|nr:hypothetical protein [Sulfitobacter sp.]